MVQKKIFNRERCIVEIQIYISWEELEPKWERFFQSQTNEITAIRSNASQDVHFEPKLHDKFLKPVMQEFLIEALKGSDIFPIDYPKFEIISYNHGVDLNYKVLVTNRPIVTVGLYKNIQLVKPNVKPLSEEDINKVINDLYANWLKKAKLSDKNSSIVDHEPEFLNSLNFNTMVDLRITVRKNLQELSLYNSETEFEEAILQAIEKITQVDLPDILIEDELNKMLVNLQRKVANMGLLLEDYLKKQGKTVDI